MSPSEQSESDLKYGNCSKPSSREHRTRASRTISVTFSMTFSASCRISDRSCGSDFPDTDEGAAAVAGEEYEHKIMYPECAKTAKRVGWNHQYWLCDRKPQQELGYGLS